MRTIKEIGEYIANEDAYSCMSELVQHAIDMYIQDRPWLAEVLEATEAGQDVKIIIGSPELSVVLDAMVEGQDVKIIIGNQKNCVDL